MTLAELYQQNARQCANAAERADNPVDRVMLLRVACDWWQEAAATTQSAVAEQRQDMLTVDGIEAFARHDEASRTQTILSIRPVKRAVAPAPALPTSATVRRTLSPFMGRVRVSFWARYAAANDMPAYSGGEGRESSACPLRTPPPNPPTFRSRAF